MILDRKKRIGPNETGGTPRGRPRILYVITRAELGGAQMHVLNLCTSMQSDFKIDVATGEEGFLTNECRRMGIGVHILPHLQREISPLSDAKALAETLRLIRCVQPDLIHAHTFKAGFIGRLAAHRLGTPSIYTVHMWPFGFPDAPRGWRVFGPPIERLCAKWCDRIITVARAGTEIAQRYRIMSPSKITWIHNGIPDCLERAALDTTRAPVITMVARFTEPKDHEVLLRAFANIPRGPILWLIGDGPGRSHVERLAGELDIADRVVFMGDRTDVSSLLASSDVFVLSSKSELFPISILEAMRAGLPIIASNVGGISEAVLPDETGLLVASHSVSAMTAALVRVTQEKDLRIRLGRAARHRFERYFLSDRMTERTRSVYYDVLKARGEPRFECVEAAV